MRFREYNSGGLRLLVPAALEPLSGPPTFYAEGPPECADLLIEVHPRDAEPVKLSECEVRGPVAKNPDLSSRILRQGAVVHPYPGWERVWESALSGGTVQSEWALVLYPSNELGVTLTATSDEYFANVEPLWTMVIRSLRIRAAADEQGVERAARARPTAIPPEPRKNGTRLPARISYLDPVCDLLSRYHPDDLNDDAPEEVVDAICTAVREHLRGTNDRNARETINGDLRALDEWARSPDAPESTAFVYGVIRGLLTYGGLGKVCDE